MQVIHTLMSGSEVAHAHPQPLVSYLGRPGRSTAGSLEQEAVKWE